MSSRIAYSRSAEWLLQHTESVRPVLWHVWVHVQVRTYDVVPVSSSLGLVEFVPGTQPLKNAIMALIDPEVCLISPCLESLMLPLCPEIHSRCRQARTLAVLEGAAGSPASCYIPEEMAMDCHMVITPEGFQNRSG